MTRLSFAGSTGSLGPTNSSRLPLPLVSTTIGVQPCDLAESPVSKKVLVLIQPTTPLLEPGPPCESHSVLSASFAKYRWCAKKQVSTWYHFCCFWSQMEPCRPFWSSGITFAERWSEPFLQKAGLSAGRQRALKYTRPCSSIIALCRDRKSVVEGKRGDLWGRRI